MEGNNGLDVVNLLSVPGKGGGLEKFMEDARAAWEGAIRTQKSGEVTLKLRFEHVKDTDEFMLVTSMRSSFSVSAIKPATGTLWGGADGQVHLFDTRSDALPGIREVQRETPLPSFVDRTETPAPVKEGTNS